MKNWFERVLMIAVSLVVLGLSASSFAQQPAGSNITGVVTDELGSFIKGAKVTIVLPGGKQRVVVTDANGEFSLPNINTGVYNFFIESKGFTPYSVPDFKVPHDKLTVTMVVAGVEIATDVNAEAPGVSVEPDQNMSATVLGEDFIKDLPDNEDDLRDVLTALAGPGAGASNGGQGGAEILVNGFSGANLPPKEAIMRITINSNPYSAEFSNPGFGRIEIVTKPGNDSWRGSLRTSFRNSALDGRNAFALVRPDWAQQQYDFNLSGPLIKKKMSFFATFERRNASGQSTTNAITLAGPFTANIDAPSNNTSGSVRVDYLVNDKNTVGLSYNRSVRTTLNQEFAVRGGGGFGFGGGGGGGGGTGVTNFTLPERGTDSTGTNNDMQLIWTTILSSRLVNEARARLGYNSSRSTARTAGVAINVLDAFNGGGSPSGHTNSTLFDYELQDYLTYTVKKHTIKGGFQVSYNKENDFSANNFNGTYTFPSLDFYKAILAGTTPTLTNGRGVYQFTANTGTPVLKYNQAQYSWFYNDDFRLTPTFTLSYGLRHEFQEHLGDKNNLAPRVGIAWSPFKDKKTTIRAGGGLFYQRLSVGTYAQVLRYNGTTQQSIVILNPVYNPNFVPGSAFPLTPGSTLSVQNTSIRILDPNMKAPYSANFNISVERQLPKGLVATVNYIRSDGAHQFRMRNVNAPLPGTITTTTPDGVRPNPAQGNIFEIESSAASKANILNFSLNRRTGKWFSFFGNYSFSSIYNNSDGMSLPADSYNLRSEWGPSGQMSRHQVTIMGRSTLPKGFALSTFIIGRSGNPFNINLGQDLNKDTNFGDRPAGLGRNADLTPDLYSGINLCRTFTSGTCSQTYGQWLAATYPNGVKAIGPGFINVNMTLSRTWGFGHKDSASAAGRNGGGGGGRGGGGGGGRGGGGGGMGGMMGGMGGMMGGGMMGGPGGGTEGKRFTLQLTAQVNNVFNHVNLSRYTGTLSSPYFNAANSASSPRTVELQLRFGF